MTAMKDLLFLKITLAVVFLCILTPTEAGFAVSPLVLAVSNSTCLSQSNRDAARDSLRNSVTNVIQGVVRNLPQCGPGAWYRIPSSVFPITQCPNPWVFSQQFGGCTSPLASGSCSRVSFPTGQSYNKVCGRATGRAIGALEGFFGHSNDSQSDIYVDGITINVNLGQGQMEHVWTFAAASFNPEAFLCPCSVNSNLITPSFVGDNYFCEEYIVTATGSDVWDGNQCLQTSNECCVFNSPPYFNATLSSVMDMPLEVSICRNEEVMEENILLTSLELYVQHG